MDKTYNHKLHEKDIYTFWEKGGYFPPSPKATEGQGKPFTIIMPPPNANDPLHIGHARFVAIEDTLIRYHRMKGEPTLWLPGADHAGIETQFVFEKRLKEQGKSRFDFDRDTLFKMIWDYVQENKGVMENQLRILGASCDWTRNKFTLDPEIQKIVYKTFKALSDDGLLYRGDRLVNYCTVCGTGYSELEVDRIERTDPLYYVRYKKIDSADYVVVATTRPEPIFADTHLAVNPKDKKNKDLIGTKVLNPLTKQEMEIIGDEFVDPEFGTGIVKLTPAHDFNDFQVAEKHNLPIIRAINPDGKISQAGGKYAGLYVKKARAAIVHDLQENGLIEKIDDKYQHVVGICYRCKTNIEPMTREQWFVKIRPLADKALQAVKKGEVKFAAERFEKIAIHWLKNLRDWNISRQIVWGMAIPAWQCKECNKWIITDSEAPMECSCGSRNLVQDPDTFDTWFSSGQWPFATLQTTEPGDFEYFYPTSVMNTGYDIVPFWVLRMIMLGLYTTGNVPFKNVLVHGLVRDAQGQKISKSKGNVINPIEMADKYGTDALRMGILWGALVESDIALSENNIRGQRNFGNKIWNIARFVLSTPLVSNLQSPTSNEDDERILKELNESIKKITDALDQYRLSEAAEELYEFVWKKFADVYLEKTKDRRGDAQPTLLFVLQESLKLAHPFMPFITEAIWKIANKQYSVNSPQGFFKEEALITARWPAS
ncbi:MAG: valyl-tRNA synthetase [Microgenomates group bacterium Gr01-1014_5]|nr:MAG: valyl-tRNA synthetase [Microgenomates group bacterium Gr01-1014_5]